MKSIISDNALFWLAGLLEGEGCFRYQESPMIELQMTDEDIVSRAATITQRKYSKKSNTTKTGKNIYHLRIFSQHAIDIMSELHPLMGARRRSQIEEVMKKFDSQSQVNPRIENIQRQNIIQDIKSGLLTLPQIAEKYSRPYSTIYGIASRGGWR